MVCTIMAMCLVSGTMAQAASIPIECTKTGIRINSNYESFEVCIQDYCTTRSRFKWARDGKTDVWIPLAIKTRSHHVTAKIHDGKSIEVFEKDCKAESTCEAIDCTICFQNIANPECSPYWAWTGLGVILYLVGLVIYCCSQVAVPLGRPVKMIWILLKAIFRFVISVIIPSQRKRYLRWPTKATVGLIIISLLMGCQEIDTIHQDRTECTINNNRKNCTNS
uniref:Uncharacterized protein n=1 Tax=Caenorhabditis japonica TaxID=281687 RepID=A0A8R1EC22_CAEJA